jgi:hypothetical protein
MVRVRTFSLPGSTISKNLVRRQYLMLTPQEQETPGTALGSPRPSRDMSSYEEPGYTGKMT